MTILTADSQAWFSDIYAQEWPVLWGYLCHLLSGDQEQAADLVQETFTRAWKALPEQILKHDLHTPQDLKSLTLRPWLYRIARNCAIDALRRTRLARWCSWEDLDLELPDGSHADPQDAYLLTGVAGEVLRGLPAKQRAALILSCLHCATPHEIAERLGLEATGIKTYLTRARAAFRARYRELTGEQNEQVSRQAWRSATPDGPSQEQQDMTIPDVPALPSVDTGEVSMMLQKSTTAPQGNHATPPEDGYIGVIIDSEQKTRQLALSPSSSRLLLDGIDATIIGVNTTSISIRTVEGAIITISPDRFWLALMGDEPVAGQAGLLLAETLARWQVEQARRQPLQVLQEALEQLCTLGRGLEALTLPERLPDDFTRKVLERYDNSAASVEAIAFMLGQPHEGVVALLRQLGKQVDVIQGRTAAASTTISTPPASPPEASVDDEAAATSEAPLSAPQLRLDRVSRQREQFRWTPELKCRLEEEFLKRTETSNAEAVRAVADVLGLPEEKVHYQVYQLGLHTKRRAVLQGTATPTEEQNPTGEEEGGSSSPTSTFSFRAS